MTTKETLFATRRDATPAQKMDLRLDVEVPAGTQLLKCQKIDDRWLITVNLDGKKLQLVTYRDPLGKTPRARPARSLRYTCQFGSSALNAGCQRERSEKSTDTQRCRHARSGLMGKRT